MDRREFLKASAAIAALGLANSAASIAPVSEELLEGVTYVSRTFERNGVWLIESWRKVGGQIWQTVSTEQTILFKREWDFFPFVKVTRR